MQVTNEQAKKAAEWWAEQIKSPSFDNGDQGPAGGMATMLALMANEPQPQKNIDDFRNALEALVLNDSPNFIGVDYHPDLILSVAAEMSGMRNYDMATFPWKTRMWLGADGSVVVSRGYGGQHETILEASDSAEQGNEHD